jgi:AmmeMemoRadiSam system protein B
MKGLRLPSVAGLFYPADPAALRAKLAGLLVAAPQAPARAALSPHAGYDYSGRVAAAVYARIVVPRDVVLLSFNHRGRGARFGTWPRGAWRTPLGDVPVAEDLVRRLREAAPDLEEDEAGFTGEHSGEVQVPFLQMVRPDVRIAPLSVNAWEGRTLGREDLARFGATLATAVRDELVLATTDLTHCGAGYGAPPPPGRRAIDWTRSQDLLVLDALKRLDEEAFWEAVAPRGVSMCGVGPTAALIAYARARGASSAEVVAYETSADNEPDDDRAVGYPGVIIR